MAAGGLDDLLMNAAQVLQPLVGEPSRLAARSRMRMTRYRINAMKQISACPNAPGQAVVDGSDLDVGLQHAKAALDVGQAPVALHHLVGCSVSVGHQQQLAVEEFQVVLALLVEGITEQVALEVDLHDMGQMGFFDRVMEPRLRARVRQRSPTLALAGILGVERALHC